MNKIIYILAGIILLISYFKGYQNGITEKLAEQKPCPDCNCPPQTKIDLGTTQFDKLNNKKGVFNIHQSFQNVQIQVTKEDSLFVTRAIRSAE